MHRYTSKIVLRKDVVRKDGTSPLYLQVFINQRRKRFPLMIFVKANHWRNGGYVHISREKERTEKLTLLVVDDVKYKG